MKQSEGNSERRKQTVAWGDADEWCKAERANRTSRMTHDTPSLTDARTRFFIRAVDTAYNGKERARPHARYLPDLVRTYS